MGRRLVLWGQPRRFPIFGVLRYLCLHSLKKNDQIARGNAYVDGLLLGGQPCCPSEGGVALADPVLQVHSYLCVHGET